MWSAGAGICIRGDIRLRQHMTVASLVVGVVHLSKFRLTLCSLEPPSKGSTMQYGRHGCGHNYVVSCCYAAVAMCFIHACACVLPLPTNPVLENALMHIQCRRTTIVGYKLVMVSRHVHTFFQEYISEEGVILAILHSIVCYPFVVKKRRMSIGAAEGRRS